MDEWTVSEWVEAGEDRRWLRQPRHVLCKLEGYTLYAYGDVIGPDGDYLGLIDELYYEENLPFDEALHELWAGFVKYWHGREYLDRWDDDVFAVIRLDHQTGQYLIEDEGISVSGTFATVGEALWEADPNLWTCFHGATNPARRG